MLPELQNLGNFSQSFITSSQTFSTKELFGVLFIVFAVAFYYGHFINTLPTAAE